MIHHPAHRFAPTTQFSINPRIPPKPSNQWLLVEFNQKHLGRIGLVTNRHKPLDAKHTMIGINGVRGEVACIKINEGSALNLSPRSPGGFSRASFARPKGARPRGERKKQKINPITNKLVDFPDFMSI